MGEELLITELSTTVLPEGNEFCKYQEFFPMIGTPAFAINLKKLFSVVEGGVEKGLVFSHRLIGKFSEFGKTDFSLLIYSEHQNCGTGRRVVEMLLDQNEGAVFIVSETNRISLSLFQSIPSLNSTQLGKFFVFRASCIRMSESSN